MSWCQRDGYRASSSVLLTEFPQYTYWKKHKRLGSWRLQPWIALLWIVKMFKTLSMPWWDCASTGEPPSPMDVSMGSVAAENTRKTSEYLIHKFFSVFDVSALHACMRTVQKKTRCPKRITFYCGQCVEWNADVIGATTAYELSVAKYFVIRVPT